MSKKVTKAQKSKVHEKHHLTRSDMNFIMNFLLLLIALMTYIKQ